MNIHAQEELTTGVTKIDKQHAELFRRVNLLYDACKSKKGREEVLNTMDFLASHIHVHMHEEESYMLKYGYSHYLEHRAEHSQFVEIYKTLAQKLLSDGPTSEFVTMVNQTLRNWLLTHMQNEDIKLAEFLKVIKAR